MINRFFSFTRGRNFENYCRSRFKSQLASVSGRSCVTKWRQDFVGFAQNRPESLSFCTCERKAAIRNSKDYSEQTPRWFKSKLEKMHGEETKESGKRLVAPPWRQPTGHRPRQGKPLYLMNSLTRKKELFVPENGNRVQWYICGPTVYDSAHMGHARSYVSFDILRRVLQDYFGYDINYVMNITDIDDKIIKRARQRYLIEKYLDENRPVQKLVADLTAAIKLLKGKLDAETNPDKRIVYQAQVEKIDETAAELEEAVKRCDGTRSCVAKQRLLDDARDALADWLDFHHGASIVDHSVFNSLAKKYEAEFFQDMAALNVLPPDVLTRVSEYIPEIIAFIQRIIDNGYAYETHGSVYFDTVGFEQSNGHYYAKLVPEAYADDEQVRKAMREGEGELSIGEDRLAEKRGASDFALWKASKAGEPFWASPWGKGRPGWHIECSVMASAICGPVLDIHAGGFDLKFPHHDNEIAQAEAHFQHDQWVNYFLHAGTLKIAGMKMSKSLKNFITIKDALKQYTSRQLRLLFLLQHWPDVVDYNHSNMERALQFEKVTNEFLLCVKYYVRQNFKTDEAASFIKFGKQEIDLDGKFTRAKQAVDEALCDSLDIRTAMETIRDLISNSNTYIMASNSRRAVPNCLLLRNVALYVTRLLKVFGVMDSDDDIGYVEGSDHGNSVNREHLVMPYVEALCSFRESVRQVAKDKKLVEILTECDRIRDDVLPELGVRLEDREGHTMVKLVDRETLLKQRDQERQLAEERRLEKERKRAANEAKEAQRRVPPWEMFLKETDKYSKFDDKGLPTHDAKGEEIGKKLRQKLQKQYDAQAKKYEDSGASAVANGCDGDRRRLSSRHDSEKD